MGTAVRDMEFCMQYGCDVFILFLAPREVADHFLCDIHICSTRYRFPDASVSLITFKYSRNVKFRYAPAIAHAIYKRYSQHCQTESSSKAYTALGTPVFQTRHSIYPGLGYNCELLSLCKSETGLWWTRSMWLKIKNIKFILRCFWQGTQETFTGTRKSNLSHG